MTCFTFRFKSVDYFVLVERFVPPDRPPQYYIVKLTFVDSRNLSRTLACEANTVRTNADARAICQFFGITKRSQMRSVMDDFHAHLGRFVPAAIPNRLNEAEHQVVVAKLSVDDGDDANKIYCIGTRRNRPRKDGSPGQRSIRNSQKTDMLRPELYQLLKADTNVSFNFSRDSSRALSDAEILRRFRENQM